MKIPPTAAELFERLPRFFRRHKLMRAWMWLTSEDPVQLVRIRGDAFAYADLSDGFLRLIVIDGDYDKDFFRVAEEFLKEGGDFLDVGANHGLLSFGLARYLGDRVRFHMFEPNSKLLDSISKSLKGYPSMQAEINPVAVSDRNGKLRFHIDNGQTGVSHLDTDGEAEVRSITLDAYVSERTINCIKLLKLDIEGYELTALRGAHDALEKRIIQAVYFEYFEKYLVRVSPPSELFDYLDSLSYTVCFCRHCDFAEKNISPTHTIKDGLPGHGLPLVPVNGIAPPAMTDLLAVPSENLVWI